jgi:hypothetical protein
MVQSDSKGYYCPTKVFPCDCGTEGVVLAVVEDEELPDHFINMAFWECGSKLGGGDSLTHWERIKYAWHILRGGSPWTSMVCMNKATARNLANHIIYLLGKAKQRKREILNQ